MGLVRDKIQQQKKEEEAYKFFLSSGWKPHQASAIVGNLKRESNFDTSIKGTADTKGSVGIAQWHSGRLDTLKKKYGSNWADFRNQLEFVNWELNNTHKSAGDALRQTRGVWDAGRAFTDKFEAPKVKWGILSTGWIAEKFVRDLALANNAECVAVGSRTIESASQFAEKYHIPRAYGSYEELVSDPDVEVIYIATPHPYHKDNVLTCLQAGKAVLCEKPFTINSSELTELVHVARDKRLFLMEAMWTRYLPATIKVMEWIKDGRIGEVQMLKAEFGFHAEFNPQGRLFNLELGGGSLLDAGIYPVSYASMIFGPSPINVHSTVRIGTTGVDEQFSLLFDYGQGKSALLSGAVSVSMPNEAIIYGSKGYISVPSFLNTHEATLHADGEEPEVFHDDRESQGYTFEAEAVGRYLREGKLESERITLEESLKLMELLDQIRGQWGLKYPTE